MVLLAYVWVLAERCWAGGTSNAFDNNLPRPQIEPRPDVGAPSPVFDSDSGPGRPASTRCSRPEVSNVPDVLVLPARVGLLGKREVTDGVMWCFAKSAEGRPRWACGSAPSREP